MFIIVSSLVQQIELLAAYTGIEVPNLKQSSMAWYRIANINFLAELLELNVEPYKLYH